MPGRDSFGGGVNRVRPRMSAFRRRARCTSVDIAIIADNAAGACRRISRSSASVLRSTDRLWWSPSHVPSRAEALDLGAQACASDSSSRIWDQSTLTRLRHRWKIDSPGRLLRPGHGGAVTSIIWPSADVASLAVRSRQSSSASRTSNRLDASATVQHSGGPERLPRCAPGRRVGAGSALWA